MKTTTILLSFLVSYICFGQTGKEIAVMIDELSSPIDMKNETTMILTNSKGKTRTNKMISQILNGSEKQITWFLEPKDDRGVAFLKIEHSDKDDEMRMWLPEFKKIRRISSKRRGDSFMSSDLSYEDLSNRELKYHTYKRLNDEIINDIDCYVIQAVPTKDAKSSYSKHISWINKTTLNILKEESFDKRGDLIKKKRFSHKKIKGYYVMNEIDVENVQKKHSTKVVFNKIEVDQGIRPSLFQEKSLKRLPK